jgi:hypothetical protein
VGALWAEFHPVVAGADCNRAHAIVAVETPVETPMIRAPSIDDKVYPPAAA